MWNQQIISSLLFSAFLLNPRVILGKVRPIKGKEPVQEFSI